MTQFCRFVLYMPLHIKVHASICLKHTCTSVVAHTQTHREQYSDDIKKIHVVLCCVVTKFVFLQSFDYYSAIHVLETGPNKIDKNANVPLQPF